MPTATGSISFLGAARFQGFWNADANTGAGADIDGSVQGSVSPSVFATTTAAGGYHSTTNLTASVADYWQVNTAGTTTVDGISNWQNNDWVIYSGSCVDDTLPRKWIKLSFQDTIASIVIGNTCTAGQIHEGPGDQVSIATGIQSIVSGDTRLSMFTDTEIQGQVLVSGELAFDKTWNP